MDPLTVSWTQLTELGGRMLAAFALALPIAWEREVDTRIMGLRTLPLVAVACCAYITALATLLLLPPLQKTLASPDAPSDRD